MTATDGTTFDAFLESALADLRQRVAEEHWRELSRLQVDPTKPSGSPPSLGVARRAGSLEQCLVDIERELSERPTEERQASTTSTSSREKEGRISDPPRAWDEEVAALYPPTEEPNTERSFEASPKSERLGSPASSSSSRPVIDPPVASTSSRKRSADESKALEGIDESKPVAPSSFQAETIEQQKSFPQSTPLQSPMLPISGIQGQPDLILGGRRRSKAHSFCVTSDTSLLVPGTRLQGAAQRRRSTKGATLDHDTILKLLHRDQPPEDATEEEKPSRRGSRRANRLFSISSVRSGPKAENVLSSKTQESDSQKIAQTCAAIEELKRMTLNVKEKKRANDDDSPSQALSQMSAHDGEFKVLDVWVQGRITAFRKKSNMNTVLDFTSLEEMQGCTIKLGKYRVNLVNPNSAGFLFWNLIGLVMITYDCFIIPMEFFNPEFVFELAMQWVVRLYWTMNIFFSFCTGFMRDDGTVEMHPRRVAKNYVMSWLALDLFVVGMDWAEYLAMQSMSGLHRYGILLRGVRMIRTVRLFRIIKAPHMTKLLLENVPFSEQATLLATIAKIMMFFLWMNHVVACLWFGLSAHLNEGPDRWYAFYGMEDKGVSEQYTVSFHWSLLTFSGDNGTIEPKNLKERVFATGILFVAFVVMASYVGSITTTMTRLQIISNEQSQKLFVLRRFLEDHGISRTLGVRVLRNAQHAMHEEKSKAPESSVELLRAISQPVMMEVHFEMHSKDLLTHPFFLCYNQLNPAGIRKVCHQSVSIHHLLRGDVLFSDLETPTKPRMFFVVNGTVSYFQEERSHVVEKKQWISEGVLWTKWTHCGTARSSQETRMLQLDAETFQDCVASFPSEHAGNYAAHFVQWANKAQTEDVLTDLAADHEEVMVMIVRAFPLQDDESSSSESDATLEGASTWLPTQWFTVANGSKTGLAEHPAELKEAVRKSIESAKIHEDHPTKSHSFSSVRSSRVVSNTHTQESGRRTSGSRRASKGSSSGLNLSQPPISARSTWSVLSVQDKVSQMAKNTFGTVSRSTSERNMLPPADFVHRISQSGGKKASDRASTKRVSTSSKSSRLSGAVVPQDSPNDSDDCESETDYTTPACAQRSID